jgi:DNA repair protein RecN (Recombination protein N)
MLLYLHVKNLALIEEEEIGFQPGLNILTGETGAGKSIILGALSIALGGKVSKEILRDSSRDGLVEAVFQVTNEEQKRKLSELDVEIYDDSVILSRKISDTRAIAKVNGETVPAQKLKQVGDIFIDIYGQHEHQSLLHKKKHLEMLDDFGRADLMPVKEAVKASYQHFVELREEYESSRLDESERLREVGYLEHEIQEITDANLKVGEDEEIEKTYRFLKNSQKIAEGLNEAYARTSGDGAAELLGRAVREIGPLVVYDEKLADLSSMIQDVEGLLNDFNRELSDYMEGLEFDAETFQNIEQRLDLINDLKNKYGKSIEEVLEALEEKQQRLDKLSAYDEYLKKLEMEYQAAEEKLREDCKALSEVRKSKAVLLSEAVRNALMDLNFLDVKFEMRFSELSDYTANGFDDAEFMISTNVGEPIRPLRDVASGGELSRIMLALKTVLARNDEIDTLIFDEIDAGISGRTAQAVSEKLVVVSAGHQVICITHLPQIAAMADQHFLIEKSVVDGSTVSNIHPLTTVESQEELARMLGGTEITEAVMQNAREMKKLAVDKKNTIL